MEADEYARMYQAETRHWWYLGMQAHTRAMLGLVLPRARPWKILDAGCGTGAAMATTLTGYGAVTGFDISPLALAFCQQRDLTALAQASVTQIPFPSAYFDLVTSFDVLYERAVADDAAALSEFFRVLRPGGLALLRLPAYAWLRGQHDATVHTARRYVRSGVARLLQESGFTCVQLTYANTLLFPFAAARRLLERFWPAAPGASDLSIPAGPLNPLFQTLLSSEAVLAARVGLPFGLSVIALGQKPVHASR